MEGQIPDLYVQAGRLARVEIYRRLHVIETNDLDPLDADEIDDILDECVVRSRAIITARMEPQLAA